MKMLLLDNRSAIEIEQRGLARVLTPFPAASSFECVTRATELNKVKLQLPLLSTPISIAAHSREERAQSDAWRCHVWSKPFPSGSLLQLGSSNVLIAAPWFSFLQMAGRLNLPDAIRLGMELCGTHSTLPFSLGLHLPYTVSARERENGFVECSPITCAQELITHLEAAPCGHHSRATSAARFVADNSHSPGESRLYIMLCLPVRLGGYGLPRPELNARIDLPAELRALAQKDYYLCDMYYPAYHLAIEYDGGYHWQGSQRMDDNTRQLILEACGITCIRIDKRQLLNENLFDMQAKRIAKQLGVYMREPSQRALQKRTELRKQTLNWNVNLYG